MAIIVMIGNMKGGIGKSTCTMVAATALSQAPFNKKVIVLDLDRQASITGLRNLDKARAEQFSYEVRPSTVKEFYNSIEDLDNDFDFVFLDTGGKIDINLTFDKQEITPLLQNTDVLLIPFVAGNYSTEATITYLDFVSRVKASKKKRGYDLELIGFVNMHIKNRKDDKLLDEQLGTIASETGLKFMTNKLGFYTAYRSADTIKSLYKSKPNTNQEINFKLWIKELSKTL